MPLLGDGPKTNKEDEGLSERPGAKSTLVPTALETEMYETNLVYFPFPFKSFYLSVSGVFLSR